MIIQEVFSKEYLKEKFGKYFWLVDDLEDLAKEALSETYEIGADEVKINSNLLFKFVYIISKDLEETDRMPLQTDLEKIALGLGILSAITFYKNRDLELYKKFKPFLAAVAKAKTYNELKWSILNMIHSVDKIDVQSLFFSEGTITPDNLFDILKKENYDVIFKNKQGVLVRVRNKREMKSLYDILHQAYRSYYKSNNDNSFNFSIALGKRYIDAAMDTDDNVYFLFIATEHVYHHANDTFIIQIENDPNFEIPKYNILNKKILESILAEKYASSTEILDAFNDQNNIRYYIAGINDLSSHSNLSPSEILNKAIEFPMLNLYSLLAKDKGVSKRESLLIKFVETIVSGNTTEIEKEMIGLHNIKTIVKDNSLYSLKRGDPLFSLFNVHYKNLDLQSLIKNNTYKELIQQIGRLIMEILNSFEKSVIEEFRSVLTPKIILDLYESYLSSSFDTPVKIFNLRWNRITINTVLDVFLALDIKKKYPNLEKQISYAFKKGSTLEVDDRHYKAVSEALYDRLVSLFNLEEKLEKCYLIAKSFIDYSDDRSSEQTKIPYIFFHYLMGDYTRMDDTLKKIFDTLIDTAFFFFKNDINERQAYSMIALNSFIEYNTNIIFSRFNTDSKEIIKSLYKCLEFQDSKYLWGYIMIEQLISILVNKGTLISEESKQEAKNFRKKFHQMLYTVGDKK